MTTAEQFEMALRDAGADIIVSLIVIFASLGFMMLTGVFLFALGRHIWENHSGKSEFNNW